MFGVEETLEDRLLCGDTPSASLFHCQWKGSLGEKEEGREQERERGGVEVLASWVAKEARLQGSCCVEEGDRRENTRQAATRSGGEETEDDCFVNSCITI